MDDFGQKEKEKEFVLRQVCQRRSKGDVGFKGVGTVCLWNFPGWRSSGWGGKAPLEGMPAFKVPGSLGSGFLAISMRKWTIFDKKKKKGNTGFRSAKGDQVFQGVRTSSPRISLAAL